MLRHQNVLFANHAGQVLQQQRLIDHRAHADPAAAVREIDDACAASHSGREMYTTGACRPGAVRGV